MKRVNSRDDASARIIRCVARVRYMPERCDEKNFESLALFEQRAHDGRILLAVTNHDQVSGIEIQTKVVHLGEHRIVV